MNKNRFDSHCHFFNLEYLILELLSMIADDKLDGFADVIGADRYGAQIQLPKPEEGIGEIIVWFLQLLSALFSDCNAHYASLVKNYKKGFGTRDNVSAVPLMMDIFYMFQSNKEASMHAARSAFNAEEFGDRLLMIGKSMGEKITMLGEKSVLKERDLRASYAKIHARVAARMDKHGKRVVREKSGSGFAAKLPTVKLRKAWKEIEMSPGYLKHARELVSLARWNRGKVFPFLAVDPRRKGVMEMIETGKPILRFGGTLVSKDGPFYGIKFYPRLGYLPDDSSEPCNAALLEVVDYCIRNDFPVVTHAGPDGFPPLAIFPHWKYETNSNPIHWDNLMREGRGRLRINLAHFGNESLPWRSTILQMMNQYDNVYSDVACIFRTDVLAEIKALWDSDPAARGRLKERLMFGTDYDVLLLADPPYEFGDFFKGFTSIFSEEDIYTMSVENPRRFLGMG